jgi:hypothetical protein
MASGAGMRSRSTAHVDQPDLPSVGIGIVSEKPLQSRRGWHPVAHELQAVRPEAGVGVGLRCDCTGVSGGPWHDRASRQKLRGDGDACFSNARVDGDDRERCNCQT